MHHVVFKNKKVQIQNLIKSHHWLYIIFNSSTYYSTSLNYSSLLQLPDGCHFWISANFQTFFFVFGTNSHFFRVRVVFDTFAICDPIFKRFLYLEPSLFDLEFLTS